MADENIVIQVTDKVDNGPSEKFRSMADEAIKAASAIEGLGKSIKGLPTTTVAKIAASLNSIANATAKVTAADLKMAAASDKAALANQKLATEVAKTARAEAQAELAKNQLAASANRAQVAEQKLGETQAQAIARISKLIVTNTQQADATKKVATATIELTEAQKAARAASVAETQARINAANAKEIEANKAKELAAANLAAAQSATRRARDEMVANKQRETAASKTVKDAEAISAALAKTGNQARLTRMQVMTLQYTASDIVASLGSGISPLTILLQQGPQVAQSFTKEIAAFGRAVGVAGGIAATFATVVVGIGLAYNSAAAESAKFNNALAVTGNFANLTEEKFVSMARSIAEATNRSVAAAREVAEAFVSSGRFQGEVIEQNSVSVLRLAKLTGQSADEITKSFIQMADSPTSFAESLNKSYHFLSSAQLTQIRQLEEMGEKTKATELTSKALYDYLGNVDSKLGPLASGWNQVSKFISDATTNLQEFVRTSIDGAGPAKELADINKQLEKIKNLNSIASGSGFAKAEADRLTARKSVLESELKTTEENNKKQSEQRKLQGEIYESSKRISTQWLKTVDNVSEANRKIAAFRADLAKGLQADKGSSEYKDALTAQAKQAEIEKKLRESNMPSTKASDKTGETRALAISKINAELQKQVDGLGVLKPQREIQQQLDQYDLDLASRKITLNDAEKESIKQKLLAIQNYNAAQQETDRIYEAATGPLRDYNATIDAASALLKSGSIDQARYNQELNRAQEQYANSQDPLRQYNRELEQEADLLRMSAPERETAQQLMQIENSLRSQGLSLIDASTDALTKEGQALKQKIELNRQAQAVQQQYDAIYAQTKGAEEANAAAIRATTLARQNGILSAEQYSIKMNQLGVQAANLRIQAGQALDGDALLASFGRVIDGYQGIISGASAAFGDMFVTISDGFANAIAGAISGTESLGDAIKNVAQQAVQQLIASLIKLGIQYAVNAAIGNALGAASVASSVALGASTAVAWAPAAAAVSLATFGANAAPASAGILSTNAVSMGAAMAGFQSGGYTGNGATDAIAGVVHGKEFVMNAEATQRIGVSNLQAMQDGRSVAVQSGSVATSSVGMNSNSPNITVSIINNADNSQVTTTKQEDENGDVDFKITVDNIEQALASRMSSGRGPLNTATKTTFGLSNSPQGGRT